MQGSFQGQFLLGYSEVAIFPDQPKLAKQLQELALARIRHGWDKTAARQESGVIEGGIISFCRNYLCRCKYQIRSELNLQRKKRMGCAAYRQKGAGEICLFSGSQVQSPVTFW
jgi:hypothetical protein